MVNTLATADDVPFRAEAEDVRAWLVELRGGGAFLSPRDGALLHGWLQAGVTVPQILRGIEATVEKRRARPIRTPLSLAACRAQVERQAAGRGTSRIPDTHAAPPPHAHRELGAAEAALATEALAALAGSPGEARLDAGCRIVRGFHARLWELLHPLHAELLAVEAEAFAPFRDAVDEATFAQLCEEAARGRLRARHPHLTITAVCEAA